MILIKTIGLPTSKYLHQVYPTILYSHSNLSKKFLITKMQTSITAFFKTKPPVKEEEKDNDSEMKDENAQSVKKENDHDVADQVASNELATKTSKKRPLESGDDSWADYDDDDDKIYTAKNKKRQALSSAETTPVKKRDDAFETNITSVIKDKIVDSPGVTTPAKQQNPVMQGTTNSPMFSVEGLIKKKISSGAFALHENIGITWFKALQNEFDKPYFKKLSTFVQQQRQAKTVFPPPEQVYSWTHHHSIRDTRVIIIGQDPYHGPNQAHGLSFSVQKGVMIPKSLQNIYKELQIDIPNFKHPGHGNLTGWSKQGVLMLNACLTVNKGEANSHQGKGWETFTDAVISWISKNVNHKVVFLLWGRFAQKKSAIIDKRHKVLTSAHPSPLSADNGFFNCKHFSQTNAFLRSQKLPEINWADL